MVNQIILALGRVALSWEFVALAVAGVVAVVGLIVAYHGFRGYVRNKSQRLLCLTIGTLFLTTVPFVIEVIIQLSGTLIPSYNILASQLLNVVGLVLILYGFTQA